jgi:transposase-like protein
LEVTSQEVSQADAARKYGVDVSVVVRLRALAKDAAIAAFTAAKPGRPVSAEQVEVELLREENDRLSEALKEIAIELTVAPGKATLDAGVAASVIGGGFCSAYTGWFATAALGNGG